MGEKKYTFLVHPEANKSQIKEAVEKMFDGTKVKSVNTMNLDGKKKRRGMVVGKLLKQKSYRSPYRGQQRHRDLRMGSLINNGLGFQMIRIQKRENKFERRKRNGNQKL